MVGHAGSSENDAMGAAGSQAFDAFGVDWKRISGKASEIFVVNVGGIERGELADETQQPREEVADSRCAEESRPPSNAL